MGKIIDFQSYEIEKKIKKNTYEIKDITKSLYFIISSYKGAIPIVDLASKYGFRVISKKMNNNLYGQIMINSNTKEIYGFDKVILVNKDLSLKEKRFIVVRELSYYLFYILENFNINNKNILIKNNYLKNNKKDKYEEIAELILLPDKEFYKQFLKTTKSYNMSLAENELSKYFGAPKKIVKNKIQKLF